MASKNCKTYGTGNELSEYDTVQSTALVDGRRYLTLLCSARLLYQLVTSESGSYDAGITCVRESSNLLNLALIRAHRLLQT